MGTNRKQGFVGILLLVLTLRISVNYTQEIAIQNSTIPPPPLIWSAHWLKHKPSLTRVYLDSHVVGYIDKDVNLSVKWPFEYMSKVWRYVKSLYRNFGPDSHIYAILHSGKPASGYIATYFLKDVDFKNVIDFGRSGKNAWAQANNYQEIVRMTAVVGVIVEFANHQTKGSPGNALWDISEWNQIFVYDVLVNMEMPAVAQEYLESGLESSANSPREDTYWFRDWFFPIYNEFGASVLNEFFRITSANYPRQEILHPFNDVVLYEYIGDGMNMGELVHFWSAAANTCLKCLAKNAFGWTDEYEVELEDARKQYPQLEYSCPDCKDSIRRIGESTGIGGAIFNPPEPTGFDEDYSEQHGITNSTIPPPPLLLSEHWFGHNQNLTRVYLDSHVAGYIDEDVDPCIRWPFEYISKVWRYVKERYGNFGPDQHFYIFLHSGEYANFDFSLYFLQNVDFKNAIDLEMSWTQRKDIEGIVIMTGLVGMVVEFANKQTKGSPGYKVWGGFAWNDIFTYDVLLNMETDSVAQAYLESSMESSENSPRDETYWFRDWFFPIYKKYGASVLNDFFTLTSANYPRQQFIGPFDNLVLYEYIGDGMNMGQLVHFWSAATNTSLKGLATNAFGWTDEYEAQLEDATKRYPQLQYSCPDCRDSIRRLEGNNAIVNATSNYPDPAVSGNGNEKATDNATWIAISTTIFLAIVLVLAVVLFISRLKIRALRQQIPDLTIEDVKEFFEGSGKPKKSKKNNESIHAMPFDKSYELSMDRFVIEHDQVLGTGHFGLVLRGFLKNVEGSEDNAMLPIAIKTVKEDVDVELFKALLMELKVMAYLGKHENIASFLGACTTNIKNREIYVALELCENGDLREFLIKSRCNFKNLFVNPDRNDKNYLCLEITPETSAEISNSVDTEISTWNLLQWSREIATAMTYLTEKKVIHGDLAARNVLLTANLVAKISDFGLSRQLVNYATYIKTQTTPLPWRWLSIEALQDMIFSIQSDVWSFGVTMWEIFSLGATPYSGWTFNYDFADKLTSGSRLQPPINSNDAIYKVMSECWKLIPDERPSFIDIVQHLNDIISSIENSQI